MTQMTKKHKIFHMKNLVTILALISISLIVKLYWLDDQKILVHDDSLTKSFTLEPDVQTKSDEIDILKAEIKNNRESVAKLSRDIGTQFAQLQNNISKWAEKSESIDNLYKDDEQFNEMTEKDAEEKINTDTNQQIALMEITLQDKESDPKWSMEAKQVIYEAFSSDELEGINLNNAECGSTLCRANFSLDGTKEAGESFRDITDQAPWPGQGFVKIDEESGEVEFYLAKEGHKLPKIEEEENLL